MPRNSNTNTHTNKCNSPRTPMFAPPHVLSFLFAIIFILAASGAAFLLPGCHNTGTHSTGNATVEEVAGNILDAGEYVYGIIPHYPDGAVNYHMMNYCTQFTGTLPRATKLADEDKLTAEFIYEISEMAHQVDTLCLLPVPTFTDESIVKNHVGRLLYIITVSDPPIPEGADGVGWGGEGCSDDDDAADAAATQLKGEK